MRSRRLRTSLSWTALATVGLWAAACSDVPHDDPGGPDATLDTSPDTTRPPDGNPLPDTKPMPPDADAGPDRDDQDVKPPDAPPDGDGSTCVVESVWGSNSTRFEFAISGGLAPIPPDASCKGHDYKLVYDAAARTLAQAGCVDSNTIDRVVDLTAVDNARVLANIGALETTCTKGCGADAPVMVLKTQTSNAPARTFQSNFYAGCQSSTLVPPFVAFDRLFALESLLRGIIAAACGTDGGSPEAGTCRPVGERDAGPDADAAVPDGDAATCQPGPIWKDGTGVNERYSSFKLRRSGGLPPPTTPDAACQGTNVEFEFFSRTLSQIGCVNNERVARVIALTDATISELLGKLRNLQSTCTMSCGADAPDVTLSVGGCVATTKTSYNSNFYAGCAGSTVPGPYVGFDDLRIFYDYLGSLFIGTCSADAGKNDAGQCADSTDGGVGVCPTQACTPGDMTRIDCNDCTCGNDGLWVCTTRACMDATIIEAGGG